MSAHSRRNFLQLLGAGALAGSCGRAGSIANAGILAPARSSDERNASTAGSAPFPFQPGIASYSFRAFTLEQVIAMTSRLGVKRLTLKDMHLPLDTPEQEIKRALERIKGAGLELASLGVIYMNNEEDVRRAFAYARAAEVGFMVGVPHPSVLPLVEARVKESGIGVAIHNHGPGDERYPSPESAYERIKNMDRRLGLCIDVGHTQRSGLDPAAEAERFADRLLDVHIKDITSSDAQGGTVEMGRGVVNIPKLLSTLRRSKYAGTLHIEFEKDEKDPLPGVAESVGYLRGVLGSMEGLTD